MKRFFGSLTVGLLLLGMATSLFWTPVSAQSGERGNEAISREEVLDVAKEIHPPGCTDSMTADYCLLKPAFMVREEIAQLLSQGLNKQEVLTVLVDKYGTGILASPPREGWSLVIWYLPYTLLLLAGAGVVWLVWRWTRRGRGLQVSEASGRTPSDSSLSEEQVRRQGQQIEEELKRYL